MEKSRIAADDVKSTGFYSGAANKRRVIKLSVLLNILIIFSASDLPGQTTYTWQGSDGADWTVSTNWNPNRATAGNASATGDILQFNTGTYSITNIPQQTVRQIYLSSGAHVTFSNSSSVYLSFVNGTGTDLEIPSNASLTLSNIILRPNDNNATITIAGELIVGTGGNYFLRSSSSSTTTVTGTVRNNNIVDCIDNTRLIFSSGSSYIHSRNGGLIPLATWNATSNCSIVGISGSMITQSSLNQSFGNFTWDCPSQSGSFSCAGNLANIAGTLTVANTGGGSINLDGNATFGNISVTGGILRFSGTGYTNNVTVNVPGNIAISGSGTLNICNNDYTGTVNLSGNLSHTSGTLSETQAGAGAVVFNGSGTQLFTSGGTVAGTINFTVNSGATLQMGTGDSPAFLTGSDASFTLSSGATLGITGENGISPTGGGLSGNIRVGGTRTYDSGANYIYMRNGNQVTGQGLPTTITGNLTVSGTSVLTPSANITANGNVTINSGATLIKGSAALAANGQLVVNGILQPEAASLVTGTGTLSGSGTVKVTRTESTADFLSQYTISNKTISSLTVEYTNSSGGQTVSALAYGNLTLSNTSGTNTAAGNITVSGTLTNSTGTLDIGVNSLTTYVLINNGSVTINSASLATNGSLIADSYSGSGTVTYKRQLHTESNDGDFHYVSSPVYVNTNANGTRVDTVFTWNEVTGKWGETTMTSLQSGRGYNLRQTTASDGLITFTGSLLTGNVSVNATSPYGDTFSGSTLEEYNARSFADGSGHSGVARSTSNYGGGGFNLLGNPYTSAIDAEAFVTYNSTRFDPNYVAVYVYDGTVGEKGVYKYIAPSVPGQTFSGSFGNSDVQAGQGFFVLAMNDFSTFTFTPAMRGHNSSVPMTKKSGGDNPWPGMVLKAKYGMNESTTTLVYNADMTVGLDPGYDVGLYSTWPSVEIYTLLAKGGNTVPYTRQALPLSDFHETEIPVGIATAAGATVTFSADVIPISGYNFWLEDRERGIFTNLNTSSYTAQIAAQTYGVGRFYLKVSDYALSDENKVPDNLLNVRVWASGNQVNVEGLVSDKATLALYDMTGRKLTDKRLAGGEYNSVTLSGTYRGVYIVRVTDGIKAYSAKVVF